MPIRISSFTKRIEKNGMKLHKAKMDRVHSLGADHAPSEAEQALAQERLQLKEERAKRDERALQPRPTALDKLVRTHRPEAKAKSKATKEAREPKEAKAGKSGKAGAPKRADKQAAKASALDADRKAKAKSAKT